MQGRGLGDGFLDQNPKAGATRSRHPRTLLTIPRSASAGGEFMPFSQPNWKDFARF
jgi:hypothetical protein